MNTYKTTQPHMLVETSPSPQIYTTWVNLYHFSDLSFLSLIKLSLLSGIMSLEHYSPKEERVGTTSLSFRWTIVV